MPLSGSIRYIRPSTRLSTLRTWSGSSFASQGAVATATRMANVANIPMTRASTTRAAGTDAPGRRRAQSSEDVVQCASSIDTLFPPNPNAGDIIAVDALPSAALVQPLRDGRVGAVEDIVELVLVEE